MRFETLATHRGRASRAHAPSLFSGCEALMLLPAVDPVCHVERAMVGQMTVGRVRSTGHEVDLSEHLCLSLVVPFSGRLVSTVGETTLSAGPGGALLFSPNRRRTRVVPEGGAPFLGVPTNLPVAAIEEAARRLDVSTRHFRFDALALELGRSATPELEELLLLVKSLHSELDRGSPRLARAEARLNWSRMIAEKLVEVLDAAGSLHLLPAPEPRPAYRHVATALDYMRAHFAEIGTIIEVADACGVSTRTLEKAFHEVLNTGPRAVLTAFRLEETRRLLSLPDSAPSVTDVAIACGFGHLGRFAAAYRARFGEAPSKTRARR